MLQALRFVSDGEIDYSLHDPRLLYRDSEICRADTVNTKHVL